ncbi:3'-5' exonuclease [Limisalsivibrio acetivorans]|uniref:3'-5' exonuclease n=1 Tax=Limisalsivibrio acetivorans TaxID=1304888 RepID=UPI0003B4A6FF|nr:3'-5' exonuclease [Limisalsivibrio acetivorans]
MRYSKETLELIDAPLNEITYTVFDTESTGTNPEGGDRVIELGAVRIKPGFRIDRKEKFQSLIDPGVDIPERSVGIHGITQQDISGAPDSCSVLYDFFDFARGTVLVAHDAPKDMAFLRREMRDYSIRNPFEISIDTLKLSRMLYPHWKSHNLDAINEQFNFKSSTRFSRHRALFDAESTANAFRIMIRKVFEERCYFLGELTEFLR